MRFSLWITPIIFAAAVSVVMVACGDDDDEDCDGEIISDCSDCHCDDGVQPTCTAYPKGDSSSNERCCEC